MIIQQDIIQVDVRWQFRSLNTNFKQRRKTLQNKTIMSHAHKLTTDMPQKCLEKWLAFELYHTLHVSFKLEEEKK